MSALLSDPVHAALLGGSILASIVIALGIVLEGKFWSLPTLLVVGGVSAEAVLTLSLFMYDEGISAKQQATIIALEERLAPRAISKADEAKLVALLKQFKGQEFTIASFDGEPATVLVRLRSILESADWHWFNPQYQILPLAGTVGIQVWGREEPARGSAKALIGALNIIGIAATLLPDQPEDVPNKEKIEIIVGNKN